MDHRAVILDGITTQHVGEALFDAPTTAPIRTACGRSYLRSIEDFAFGVLFGETLTLSGRMPPVGDRTPGAVLMQDPALKEFVVKVDIEQPTGISGLLAGVGFRSSVEEDIKAVAQLEEPDFESFRHFYIREVRAYLGDHPSILEPVLPPDSYSFSTTSRKSHYVGDRALQTLIPSSFVTAMVRVIRESASVDKVADAALNEFVSRALLTHVANYWAFDYAVEGQPHGSARLPHVTRAVIRKKVDATDPDKERQTRQRRLVYRGVVPHALLRVIAVARGEKDCLLDALRETRDSQQFRDIRNYLTELVQQLGQRDRRDADKLLAEIARKAGQGGFQQEPVNLSVPFAGDLSASTWGVLRDRFLNPGKYYLRQLIRESAYVSESEYLASVVLMFPDLARRT